MRSDWKKTTIDEACARVYSGGTPSTKEPAYWNGDMNWLSSGETRNKFIYETERKITKLGVEQSSTQLAFKDSIVIATAGQGYTRGQASFLKIDTYVNQSVLVLEADRTMVEPLFLYYNLSNRYEELRQLSDGTSTRGGLSGWIVRRMAINLPPIDIQKKIIDVLYAIDQKIECNIAINKNLEKQAQAIYRNIFIENYEKSWIEGSLSELVSIKYGRDHKKLNNGIYPVYGSGGIMRYVDRALYDKESVLIPRKGSLNNILYVNEPFWSVDTMFYTEMKRNNIAKFIFHFMKGLDLTLLNAGSAVPSMTTEILNSIPVHLPDTENLQRFENLVSPLYILMQDHILESKRLSSLRDTLLLRLMSGELDVSSHIEL